jgi:hypothetical protein
MRRPAVAGKGRKPMKLLSRCVFAICFVVASWGAYAGVETVDGQPIGSNPTMVFYPRMGNAGTYSYVTGTCDHVGTGVGYMSIWVDTHYVPFGGGTELPCDAQNRFAGYVSFLGSQTTWPLGVRSANLYAYSCDGFTACNNAPFQTAPVTVRYLDVAVTSPNGIGGPSPNRVMQMNIDSGQELGSQAGATGFFMAALYEGSIYMIYGGASITCGSGPQVMIGSGFGATCQQLVIAPYSPQTFIPIAVGAAGQESMGSVTVSFGSLDSVHGATILGGAAKSLDQLLGQRLYGTVAVWN